MTPALRRKSKLETWLFYTESNVLEPELAEIALAVREAISKAKADAYKDAASVVHHGFSFPSIHGILLKKAREFET
jgi:hypothetical protein